MAWFEQDAIDFFRELELNNNREWFEKNKKRYEANVKKPMETFADHMIGRMQEILPNITATGKQAVFRIYKDVRFSKDKTPYKTNAGMHINDGGKGDFGAMPMEAPGSLSADELYAVTSYLLFANGIIGETDEMNAATLPRVRMPNRDGFVWIDAAPPVSR